MLCHVNSLTISLDFPKGKFMLYRNTHDAETKFVELTSSMQTSHWDAVVDVDDDGVLVENDLVGRDRKGFGGISKLSKLPPSNISTTLFIDGMV
ncbi:hypothetical protein LWI28_007145 [Acer negundo]|uniref:Uncharacterized protein n=1 Tax=Acer negundo TaxID=4023 RepID=A0AAD5NH96_ACENE|nr:hypothetical protein LWI28_007145 [Acer negundo]